MNSEQIKQIKTQAHQLKPVIMMGNAGLTEAVSHEIELALDTHGLIKIKIRAERDERKVIQEKICQDTHAKLIQSIGQVIVIYREPPPKPTPKPKKQAPRRRD